MTLRADRRYFESWLSRTRKQFAISGRLSQVALLLSVSEGGTPEYWQFQLRELLEGTETPSFDLLVRIDGILSSPTSVNLPKPTQTSLW